MGYYCRRRETIQLLEANAGGEGSRLTDVFEGVGRVPPTENLRETNVDHS
jgi:hypothetical protein